MRVYWLLLLSLALVAGCGGPRIVPVSGRVTLGGKPLVNAMVVFEPLSEEKNPGPGSSGKTDGNGAFTLRLMTGKADGALVGLHKVSITAYEGDDVVPSSGSNMAFRKRLLGDEYNAESKLRFTVLPPGTTEANFDLPAPP